MSEENNSSSYDSPRIEQETSSEASPVNLLDLATAAAERLEKANAKMEANIKRQESLAVERTLAGRSTIDKSEKKEESAKEYAARVMKGDI